MTGATTMTGTGVPGVPVRMAAIAGLGQKDTVGTVLAVAPAVQVLDGNGNGVSGVAVMFAVTGGQGSIPVALVVTDSHGVASTPWALGTVPGLNVLTATAMDTTGAGVGFTGFTVGGGTLHVATFAGNPVTFNATALTGHAINMMKLGVDETGSPTAGSPLFPMVRITDAYGNPVDNITVTFTVVTGAGLQTGSLFDGVNPVSSITTTTFGGLAYVLEWDLSSTAGPNQLSVSASWRRLDKHHPESDSVQRHDAAFRCAASDVTGKGSRRHVNSESERAADADAVMLVDRRPSAIRRAALIAIVAAWGCDNPPPASAPTIVFDMIVGGNRDVYSADIYGMQLRRLTTNTAADVQPTAAKNVLAFTSFRDGNGELYSRSLSGNDPEVRLTATAANETDAALSPDGRWLAYTRDDGGLPRIWIADASGAGAATLTTAAGNTIEGSAAWRASSDSVLLMSTSLGSASIFRVSRTAAFSPASAIKPATTDSVYVEPAWSVDSRSIAFAAALTGRASRVAVRDRAAGTTIFLGPPLSSDRSAGLPPRRPHRAHRLRQRRLFDSRLGRSVDAFSDQSHPAHWN